MRALAGLRVYSSSSSATYSLFKNGLSLCYDKGNNEIKAVTGVWNKTWVEEKTVKEVLIRVLGLKIV